MEPTSLGISPKAPSKKESEFTVARHRLMKYFVPWTLASLAVWATCAGLQAGPGIVHPHVSAVPGADTVLDGFWDVDPCAGLHVSGNRA